MTDGSTMDLTTLSYAADVLHDPLLSMLASGALAILMLHAAALKGLDRGVFEQNLASYGVPDAWLPLLSWMLPLTELTAALGVITPFHDFAVWMCAALLLLYAAVMVWQLAHDRTPDCGCGGDPLPLSWALVARNAMLALLAPLASMPMVARPIDWTDGLFVLAGWTLMALLYAAFNQVLRQFAWMKRNLDRRSA
jgi:hypothetical protein